LGVWLFFPEIIGIGLMVVLSPLYTLNLVREGHAMYGGVLVVGAIAGTAAFVSFLRRGWRVRAWLTMIAVLLAFLLVSSQVDVRL
jgi:hypothetical protein